jgi:parallel beta-helix repeat protein
VITANNVRFTLGGYTISGVSTTESCDTDNPQLGIHAMAPATAVRVNGGTVTGFVDGIVLYSSKSRVHAMNVTNNCVFGIAVSGTGNVVDTSVITGSGVDGVGLGATSGVTVQANDIYGNRRYGLVISNFSDANTIQSNIFRNNGLATSGGGILVANGNNNTIRDNAANGNFDGIGLSVQITGTLIRGNTTNGNVNTGIAIAAGGTLNEIRANTARGNGTVDLADGSAGCSTNVWTKNIFATDAVAGAPDGGPGAGCIK